jgi:hypothetical protein
VLDRFERGVERVVNGAFARAFKSEVQPVELASALRREADTTAAVVGPDRTLVPNAYTIELGPSDHERLGSWADQLSGELSTALTDHARGQRYSFPGPVSIQLVRDDELATGVFRVRSARVRGGIAPGTAANATVAHPVLDVEGRRYQLTKRLTVIGRGSDCDVVLDDPGASRRHAEIKVDGGRILVRDLGSTNGTVVGGERLGERVKVAELDDGSDITIGRTTITVISRGSRASARPDEDW